MQAKENILDRIEQSFYILRNNFVELFLPIFVYNFISIVLVWTILMYFIFSNIWNLINWDIDILSLYSNPNIILLLLIWFIVFIWYLILYIPILLWTIKSISQAYSEEDINLRENILYWFQNIFNSFRTYWYIFAYVALIPSLFFILWGILFNFWYYYSELKIWVTIWGWLMIAWWILFIILAIYRWIRASFPIYSAVNNDTYTKDDFLTSISISENKWWRIVWNFILMAIIISLVSWLFRSVLWVLTFAGTDYSTIESLDDLLSIASDFSLFYEMWLSFLNNIINTIWTIFMIIFTYIFYRRLSYENSKQDTSKETIKQQIEL